MQHSSLSLELITLIAYSFPSTTLQDIQAWPFSCWISDPHISYIPHYFLTSPALESLDVLGAFGKKEASAMSDLAALEGAADRIMSRTCHPYLVGGDWNMTGLFSQKYWEFHHPK